MSSPVERHKGGDLFVPLSEPARHWHAAPVAPTTRTLEPDSGSAIAVASISGPSAEPNLDGPTVGAAQESQLDLAVGG